MESLPSDKDVEDQIVKPISTLTKIALSQVSSRHWGAKSKTFCFQSEAGCDHDVFVIIRVFDRDNKADEKVLLTVTIELPSHVEKVIANYEDMDLEETLKTAFENNFADSKATVYPVVRRCLALNPYLRTSDDRIIEYGVNKVLFAKRSPYQLVEIIDTTDFGPALILDGMINLAESDTEAYTHNLMNLPSENYKDKEVLILGGGDGALIKELFDLKRPNGVPKYVTMVDIDDAVMEGCSDFMPNVCGDFLKKGNRKGERYNIITGCAIEFLKNAIVMLLHLHSSPVIRNHLL